MNYKTYTQMEEYYLEVEKHLFRSNKTFKEFLISSLEHPELLNEWSISKDELIQFINDISVDDEINTTNKNKLVKHSIGDNYEVLTYALKGNQSYSTHEGVASRYIMKNYHVLKNNCHKVVIGGLIETTKNTRVYLYINE